MDPRERPLVLIVDDRRDIFLFCERSLGDAFTFRHLATGPEALAALREPGIAAVLLDRDFSQGDPTRLVGPRDDVRNEGVHILAGIRREHATLPVIMVTGLRDLATAKTADDLGAGFLPWEEVARDPTLLEAQLRKAIDDDRGGWVAAVAPFRQHGVVVESPVFGRVLQQLARALPGRAPILLLGPTGSGKDCLARALHALGGNAAHPFVEVNAATLDTDQVNNELFGHAKGSYTDAKTDWKGLLASADGGTFFLNEIGDLPLESQAKLLTVLESEQVRPLGSARYLPARFRLVTATSRNLGRLVAEGRFREDLWHRIAWHSVTLPPLSERPEDVPALAHAFLRATPAWRSGALRGIAREAVELMAEQPWPGNVRSVQRAIELAATRAVHTITVGDLRAALAQLEGLTREMMAARGEAAASPAGGVAARREAERLVFEGSTFADVQCAYFMYVRRQTGGNMAAAARLAGIAKSTMCDWRDRFGDEPAEDAGEGTDETDETTDPQEKGDGDEA